MKIAGVDGCHGGWVVASRIDDKHLPTIRIFDRFEGILNSFSDYVIVVDMPIGLASREKGKRDADVKAKSILTEVKRGGSVFYPPVKEVIERVMKKPELVSYNERNYVAVCEISNKLTNRKLSRQSFGILRKIVEINSVKANNVYEFHPEIVWVKTCGFRQLDYKKSKTGEEQRLKCLSDKLNIQQNTLLTLIADSRRGKSKDVSRDDIIDALAGLIVAKRIYKKESKTLPPKAGELPRIIY